MAPPKSSLAAPSSKPKKRLSIDMEAEDDADITLLPQQSPVGRSAATAFRTVTVCYRCRMRKHKCDLRLPACTSCERAGQICEGYDSVRKERIPRNYIDYLENRVHMLETLMRENSVDVPPAGDLQLNYKFGAANNVRESQASKQTDRVPLGRPAKGVQRGREQRHKLVMNACQTSVKGSSEEFTLVVVNALKKSARGPAPDKKAADSPRIKSNKSVSGEATTGGGTSASDSLFGLYRKPTIPPAPFPEKKLGLRLVELYFENANPQIPILHREDFEALVERVYSTEESKRSPKELYMLNMVFAVGAGMIYKGLPTPTQRAKKLTESAAKVESPNSKRRCVENSQDQPEDYHSAAFEHLARFLGLTETDHVSGFNGKLEELQAVLLLASYALLRPIDPGLWHIVGVAARIAIDLELHREDAMSKGRAKEGDALARNSADGAPVKNEADVGRPSSKPPSAVKGGLEWMRDMRRRLWWSVYSFDRLVCTCVGKPFSISDEVITTEFPSLAEDRYITKSGIIPYDHGSEPTYKRVATHYFLFRVLQSEILQAIQMRQANHIRSMGAGWQIPGRRESHSHNPVAKFNSFQEWQLDMDERLGEWKKAAPSSAETGVQFSPLFFELNYWQALMMLYRKSINMPLAPSPNSRANHFTSVDATSDIDNQRYEDKVFGRIAEAGLTIMMLYQRLHSMHRVSYTFLATHHLFYASNAFLFAMWHSPTVRQRVAIKEMRAGMLAASTVLKALAFKCPVAENFREVFWLIANSTIEMTMSSNEFAKRKISIPHIAATSTVQPARRPNHGRTESKGTELANRLTETFPANGGTSEDRRSAPCRDAESNASRQNAQAFNDLQSSAVGTNQQTGRNGQFGPRQTPVMPQIYTDQGSAAPTTSEAAAAAVLSFPTSPFTSSPNDATQHSLDFFNFDPSAFIMTPNTTNSSSQAPTTTTTNSANNSSLQTLFQYNQNIDESPMTEYFQEDAFNPHLLTPGVPYQGVEPKFYDSQYVHSGPGDIWGVSYGDTGLDLPGFDMDFSFGSDGGFDGSDLGLPLQ